LAGEVHPEGYIILLGQLRAAAKLCVRWAPDFEVLKAMIHFDANGKRRLLWISLLMSVGFAAFCFLGTVMSGSFAVACDVSRPQDCAHWHRASIYYEVLAAVWMVAAIASAIALARARPAKV